MHGRLHHIARWLRLLLACLSLAGSFSPAHAMPDANPVVAVSVLRRESVRPRQVVVSAAPLVHSVGLAWALERAPLACRVPEVLLPGPPRRLFIAHRALLH
ncbi:hypothetical protein [Archangium lipolyticum]|uniref:hypothetical protein n=1 Tax=Archangium lipolyticum TaxID=2970465 RepID=UPI00214A7C5F|nr:hypothetical protein [Archangium lipolyticum]